MISTIVKPRDDRKMDLFPKEEKLELEEDLTAISLASLYPEAIRSFLLSFSQKHILPYLYLLPEKAGTCCSLK